MIFEIPPLLILTVLVMLYLFSCIQILKEYERAVDAALG